MLRKLGKSNQVAIPKSLLVSLGIMQNDYFDVYIEDNKIILEPKLIIPKDQAYFYTQEWQTDEKNAQKDIQTGKLTQTKDLDELFQVLDD